MSSRCQVVIDDQIGIGVASEDYAVRVDVGEVVSVAVGVDEGAGRDSRDRVFGGRKDFDGSALGILGCGQRDDEWAFERAGIEAGMFTRLAEQLPLDDAGVLVERSCVIGVDTDFDLVGHCAASATGMARSRIEFAFDPLVDLERSDLRVEDAPQNTVDTALNCAFDVAKSHAFKGTAPRLGIWRRGYRAPKGNRFIHTCTAPHNCRGPIPSKIAYSREWRNWQTRSLQVAVSERACGFKSHLAHTQQQHNSNSQTPQNRLASGILFEVFGLRLIYLLAALATFGLLVLIETQFDSGFIRFTFGDVLVVVLVYALLMATGCITPVVAAALSLALAYAVEIGQAIDIVDRLGIEPNRLTDIVLGNTFTWSDIIAYTVGAAAALGIDLTIRRVWSPAGTPAT